MNKNSKIPTDFLFYGTLRQGNGNYQRLVAPPLANGGAEFEGTHVLTGYKMYDVGYKSYPFIVNTGNNEDKIMVEAYHITDSAYAERIHWMELGAGYGVEEVIINDKPYSIYVQKESRSRKEIDGGDWNKYISSGNAVTMFT